MLDRFLRDFRLPRRLRRLLWRLYNLRKRRRVHHDPAYFDTLLATFSRQNLPSLDATHGLVRGHFQGVPYLLKMTPGRYIESSIFLHGTWSAHLMELMASYLDGAGLAMLDVGANVGATSIPLAKRFPETHFYLFEPHPAVFSDLAGNCGINRLANVTPVNAAVSDRVDLRLAFYAQRGGRNMGLSSLKPNPDIKEYDVIEVTGVRIDDYLRHAAQRIAVIKIDTQGSELDVLKSATETISTHRPVIFFEFESEYFPDPEDERRVRAETLAFFDKHGYALYGLLPDSAYLPAVTLQGYFHGDILAVPLPR